MRTDIHRPSAPEFNPENYEFVTCFDLDTQYGDRKAQLQVINSYIDKGYRFADAGNGCGHCGKMIRYAALMLHTPTMEMLYVGEQCLINRFESMTKAQFHALREQAKLNKDRASKKERRATFIAEHPEIQTLLDYVDSKSTGKDSFGFFGSGFLLSLYDQFQHNAELSEKQLAAIAPAIEREIRNEQIAAEREAQHASLVSAGIRAPQGKVQVTGKILGFKTQESEFYGETLKMIVESVEGWKVYVTAPAGSANANVGDTVTFSATLTPSQDDVLFAYGKRPTKFSVINSMEAK